MKRMKAFFLALLLFVVTVVGCHFYITREATMDSAALGTLPSEEKGKLRSALVNNIDENGYPVFGSSEFMHGSDTAYHPALSRRSWINCA